MGSSRSDSFNVYAQQPASGQVQQQKKRFRGNISAEKTSYKA